MNNKRVKRIALTVIATCALTLGTCNAEIVATYDGGKITDKDIENRINKMSISSIVNGQVFSFDNLKSEEKKIIIEGVAVDELLYSELSNNKFMDDPEVKESMELTQRSHMCHLYLISTAQKMITEKEIKKEYDMLVAKNANTDEVNIIPLFFANENDAKKAHEEIINGNFSDIADQHNRINKSEGNYTGFITKGTYYPKVEEKAFVMNNGDISDPFECERGWCIIEMKEKRKMKFPELSEIKDNIRKRLLEKNMKNIIAKLREKYKLTITDFSDGNNNNNNSKE